MQSYIRPFYENVLTGFNLWHFEYLKPAWAGSDGLMSVISDENSEPSSGETNAVNFNSTHSVSRELYSLLDAVDSESIADEFDIGKHNKTHDFDNHLKIAVREGLDPSFPLV